VRVARDGRAAATATAMRIVSTTATTSCNRADSFRPTTLTASTTAKMPSATAAATAVPEPVSDDT